MLEKIADDLWFAEGDVVDFYSFAYPTRMVITRFGNADLWVWSSVKLTDDLKGEVDALGPVAHLVSLNKIHHLHPPEWLEAYPDAALWGPASTIEQFPALPFQPPLEDALPAA